MSVAFDQIPAVLVPSFDAANTTKDDLEKITDLDTWLRETDIHKLDSTGKLIDAWSITNTNRAFKVNDVVGVERSHRGNDWIYDGIDASTIVQPTDITKTYATQNVPGDIQVQVVKQPVVNTVSSLAQVYDQRNATGDMEVQYKGTHGVETTTSVSVQETISFSVKSSFEFLGANWEITGALEHQNMTTKSQTTSDTDELDLTFTVKGGEYSAIQVTTITTVASYRLTIPITVTGYIAKAIGDGQSEDFQHNWTYFHDISSMPYFQDDTNKKKLQQYLHLNSNVTEIKTNITRTTTPPTK